LVDPPILVAVIICYNWKNWLLHVFRP
jgi:hypothetical protein